MAFRNFLIIAFLVLAAFLAGFYYFYSRLYRSRPPEIIPTVAEIEARQKNAMYEALAKLKTSSPSEFNEKKSLETLRSLQRSNATSSSEEEMIKILNELKTNSPSQ